MTKAELIALIEQAERLPVWVILREDSYETMFGDGYYGYFAGAFLSQPAAQDFINAQPPSQFIKFHIKEFQLQLQGDNEITLIAVLSPNDRVTVDEVTGDLVKQSASTFQIKRLCVFCGSSFGTSPRYAAQARLMGQALVEQGYELVYGGGSVGLMGEVANAVLAAGGKVHGVIPRLLNRKEIAHSGLTQLHVVETMHERKAMMAELSDGFIAMPGGIGTMEELFEVWTWSQLGIHRKPCGLFNVEQYFVHLIAYIDHMVAEGLLKPEHRAMIMIEPDPQELIAKFQQYQPPQVDKWLDLDRT